MTEVLPLPRQGSVTPLTRHISPDEKVEWLEEVNRLTSDYHAPHRFQRIYVNRNGNRAVHVTDMGMADDWPFPEVLIISDWEDSVEYMRDQANKVRFENALGKFLAEVRAESTLITDWLRLKAEIWEQAHNRSHFGPKFKRERNAFVRRT